MSTEQVQSQESFLAFKKEEVREAIMQALAGKGKDSNYVNKRMQDSIVNFFMEDYVATLFCETQQLRQEFHKKVLQSIKDNENQWNNSKVSKYSQILNGYYNELKKQGLLSDYRKMLLKIVLQEDPMKNNQTCMTLMWRKQLCILLLEHCSQPRLNNVYLMWNSAYKQTPLYNKKQSFYRKNIKKTLETNVVIAAIKAKAASISSVRLNTLMTSPDADMNDTLSTHSAIKEDSNENISFRQSDSITFTGIISKMPSSSQIPARQAAVSSQPHQPFQLEVVQSIGSQVVSQIFLSYATIFLR